MESIEFTVTFHYKHNDFTPWVAADYLARQHFCTDDREEADCPKLTIMGVEYFSETVGRYKFKAEDVIIEEE